MGVTIKDIAKILNVSHTTVSRALNDSPLISPQTKERVLAIARQLNYTPNFSAKSLVQNRSYNVGLFFSTFAPSTSPHFLRETIRGAKSGIDPHFNLVIDAIEGYPDFQSIDHRRFDGMIVMSQCDSDRLFIEYALNNHMPIVLLNRIIEGARLPTVLSDDRIGAYQAVSYLIDHGHRDVALIEGHPGFYSTQERKIGYLNALSDHHLISKPEYRAKADYTMESGYRATHRLLSLSTPPSAIFCSNDEMAMGALRALAERGLAVPQDVSLLGFDDSGVGAFTNPALTTVRRQLYEMARVGSEQLMAITNAGLDTDVGTIYVPTIFVERESVGAI